MAAKKAPRSKARAASSSARTKRAPAAAPKSARKPSRGPLSRDEILRAGMALADESGVAALSMRALAKQVGVEAMSLYHHVKNKDALLAGMVDVVFSEIDLPEGETWQRALRRQLTSARAVFLRHPWVVPLLDAVTAPGPHTLRHRDTLIRCLVEGGFSLRLAAHTYALVDAYLFGFVLTEASLPFSSNEELTEVTDEVLSPEVAAAYPHMMAMASVLLDEEGYTFGAEFDWGLDLLLDGLERRLAASEGTKR